MKKKYKLTNMDKSTSALRITKIGDTIVQSLGGNSKISYGNSYEKGISEERARCHKEEIKWIKEIEKHFLNDFAQMLFNKRIKELLGDKQ